MSKKKGEIRKYSAFARRRRKRRRRKRKLEKGVSM
jgi:hypothetical protein